jgi:biopolymer transport protein ExbB/TolQ
LTKDDAVPHWKTGTLWGILAVFLVVGTVGAASVVYGLFGLAEGHVYDLIAIAVGAIVAVLAFLFMAGILYRVDRYRGSTERRIDLFE